MGAGLHQWKQIANRNQTRLGGLGLLLPISQFWGEYTQPKQVDCFFGKARNSSRWQESRMFWVTCKTREDK